MDKRTILFALAVFATLFFVNMFFDRQYEEDVRKWNVEQIAKKTEKLKHLELEAKEKTLSSGELPLVNLYSDEAAKDYITSGVITDKAVLTLSFNDTPPATVYIKNGDKTAKLSLAYQGKGANAPLVYQESNSSLLKIGNLPDIGSYELQLITPHAGNQNEPASIGFAEYQEGNVVTAQQQINELKKELDIPSGESKDGQNGILLMKTKDAYLPTAIFQGQNKRVVYLEDLIDLKAELASTEGDKATTTGKNQEYYVLENEYQQLVFSNIGGALVEINLPFSTNENKASVVRATEVDRLIVKDYPENAYFPAHPYYTSPKAKGKDFIAHSQGSLGGYYPLLRRDLIEKNDKLSVRINPRYYALNLLSEHPEVAELNYKVTHFDEKSIVFEAQQQHRKITKAFSFPKEKNAPYTFDMTLKIEGNKRGLFVSSGIPEVELFSGSPAPVLKYRITRNNKPSVEIIDLPTESVTNSSVIPDWLCDSNGFFGIIIDPLSEIDSGFKATLVPGQTVPSRLVEIDRDLEKFNANSLPGYMVMAPLKPSAITTQFRVFAGPFTDSILNAVDAAYTDNSTGYNPDYIACQSDHGWFSFISEPFAKVLFVIMDFFHSLTGSWGLSIILLTVALRIMMYPLNAWSTKSILKMQMIGPKVAEIQERYKNDPKKAQVAVMDLYRKAGVNPLSGCLPLLIQMPFLLGMFDLLKTTFELRGASFIPGWIDNLTSPDVLFSWHSPTLPIIGNEFHLLPILLGLAMFMQQKMSASAANGNGPISEQQKQQRTMGTMMTVVFTVMFYNFPSGLNIYWLSSTLLGMLQQWWTQKQLSSNKDLSHVSLKPEAPSPKRSK